MKNHQKNTRIKMLSSVFLVFFAFEMIIITTNSFMTKNDEIELYRKSYAIQAEIEKVFSNVYTISDAYISYVSENSDLTKDESESFLGHLLFYEEHYLKNIALIEDTTIKFNYPHDKNIGSIGIDLSKIAGQKEDVLFVKENLQALFVGPIELVQGGKAFILRSPISVDGSYYGQLSSVIDAEYLITLLEIEAERYNIELTLGYPNEEHFISIGDVFESSNVTSVLNGKYAVWELHVYELSTPASVFMNIVVRILGLIIAAFIGYLVYKDSKLVNKAKYDASHDTLTGLHNRRYFEEKLLLLDIPENYPITVIMADINGLKLVNDAFGHSAGDKLLKYATTVIKDSCRENDLVARMGGDEFIIVMPNTVATDAEKIIDKINTVAKTITVESIELSISFGFAIKNEQNVDIQDVYRSAEDHMYRVKLNEIPSMRSSAIETILKTLYEKDVNSEIHSRSVSEISEKIAIAYGMGRQEVNEVKTAALLHDIGKIIVPISIITKEGKLTPEEYNLIKGHPEIGFRILNSTHNMRSISNIVLNHHERWDGDGYPRGLKGADIPIQSRMITIADAYDAMTSDRTYREIFTNDEALKEILDNSGTQFDPELVEIFKEHFNEII